MIKIPILRQIIIINFLTLYIWNLLPLFYPKFTWIRIRNTDPDPQSSWIRIQYGSGSTILDFIENCFSSLIWQFTAWPWPPSRAVGSHYLDYTSVADTKRFDSDSDPTFHITRYGSCLCRTNYTKCKLNKPHDKPPNKVRILKMIRIRLAAKDITCFCILSL